MFYVERTVSQNTGPRMSIPGRISTDFPPSKSCFGSKGRQIDPSLLGKKRVMAMADREEEEV